MVNGPCPTLCTAFLSPESHPKATYHSNCNREIATQLIVGPELRGIIRVFVNAPSVDKFWLGFPVRNWIFTYPEVFLKVLLDFLFPEFISPLCDIA